VPRIRKIYTRSGDDGTTSLGSGQRAAKSSPRIEAYGTVDELNAQIGVVRAAGPVRDLLDPLQRIQDELLHMGAELALPAADRPQTPGPRIEAAHVAALERLIDTLAERLDPLKSFILPGGTAASAHLHVARTICRRAERRVVALAEREPVRPHVISYLNRLSDALFVMARFQNKARGTSEPLWQAPA
jgi:cob(I)alamin adenosyltransferase